LNDAVFILTALSVFLRLNPDHGEVYLIQHYVKKFVSDLRHVDDFLRFPQPIKLTATI